MLATTFLGESFAVEVVVARKGSPHCQHTKTEAWYVLLIFHLAYILLKGLLQAEVVCWVIESN